MKASKAAKLLARSRPLRSTASSPCELCVLFNTFNLQTRSYHSSRSLKVNPASSLSPKHMDKTPTGMSTTPRAQAEAASAPTLTATRIRAAKPEAPLTPALQRAAQYANEQKSSELQDPNSLPNSGSLSGESFFADTLTAMAEQDESALRARSETNMSLALDPRPRARSRWLRKMVIRSVRNGGRVTKAVQIARSERSHLSASHFFKTSMKKLMPLARQIAGKSIDEAILQMRFSQKKPAIEIRKHLEQAKNEAVVVKGMGLTQRPTPRVGTEGPVALENAEIPRLASPLIEDAGSTPPAERQNPMKTLKPGYKPNETDIYVAQAWINRGPYGKEPEYRARGRINILRPPHTGITVLLKEEKTRAREKTEKEEKQIKKRLGKSMWTHLPDRPVVRQSQYVLW